MSTSACTRSKAGFVLFLLLPIYLHINSRFLDEPGLAGTLVAFFLHLSRNRTSVNT